MEEALLCGRRTHGAEASLDGVRPAKKKKFKIYPIGYFHIDLTEVRTCHYDGHAQLREHPASFLDACNFAKRLMSLNGLASYQFITSCFQNAPSRFTSSPHSLSKGLNS